jgi:hypothetical protein
MKEGAYLAPRRYHRGMVRQFSRGHDGTNPREDADKAQHNTSTRHRQGEGRVAQGEARVCHGQNPRCGRQWSRGHGEAIGEISRTGRCAIARSTKRAPSRRLALMGVVRIEGAVAAIQSGERARGEEGGWRLAGSGATEPPGRARPGGPAPTGGPGPDKWARTNRWAKKDI